MSEAVSRHFVTLDGRWGPRQVHYRRAGRGPAVLLLHQSPQSSLEMVDLMRRWARHFTVIAPDTPGYGQSDPLGPPAVAIGEFADATGEFADAIGLRRFGIYGYHTGSSIGLWLAVNSPGRVTALAANGLASFDDAERRQILAHYLPAIVPTWDGAHLAWLWARVREQTIFFPWHEAHAASRLSLDMPPAARLHASVLEFMRAGDHYAIAYRAAFESQPQDIIGALRTPLLVTATPGDPLRGHPARLGELPALVTVDPADSHDDALRRCLHHLLGHRGDPAPAAVATRAVAGRPWNTMIATAQGQARVQVDLSGRAEPLLLLHGAGESSDTIRALAAQLQSRRPVVIPDLPGHGESDPVASDRGPTPDTAADAALAVLSALGISETAIAGQGVGAWVALEVARRAPLPRRRLALIDVPFLDADARLRWREQALLPIEPQWHGGHLLMAWHLLRDSRLFFPWFERNRAGARRIEPDLDPRRLQLELRELLKAEGAWQNLWRAALDVDAVAALRATDAALLGAATASAWSDATRDAAAVNPVLGLVGLPESPSGWLPELLRHWD